MNKKDFLKLYSLLPKNLHRDLIVVCEGKPYTLEVIKAEIDFNTPRSKDFLRCCDYMRSFGAWMKEMDASKGVELNDNKTQE